MRKNLRHPVVRPHRISIGVMPETEDTEDTEDTNAAVWKSDIGVSFWKSTQADRERRRAGHRALLAELLPFAPDEPFTVVDLGGGGGGAAARIILDHYPAAHAILADFPDDGPGPAELAPYDGRYRYVEYDLTKAGAWPAGHPGSGRRRDQLAVGAPSQRRAQADAVRGDPRAPGPRRLVPQLRPGPAAGRGGRGGVAAGRRPAGPDRGGQARAPDRRRSSSATRTTCGT